MRRLQFILAAALLVFCLSSGLVVWAQTDEEGTLRGPTTPEAIEENIEGRDGEAGGHDGAGEAVVIDTNRDGVVNEGDLVIVDDGTHGGAAEHEGGMPQLETASYPSQILWLIVSFGLLYWLMKSRGLPRVAEILETRRGRVDNNLERAQRLRGEAETAYKRQEEAVASAHAKAGDDVRAMREKVNAETAERQQELDAKLDERIKEAEARIDRSRRSALAEVDGVAAEVANAMIERLVGKPMSEADVRSAVENAKSEAA